MWNIYSQKPVSVNAAHTGAISPSPIRYGSRSEYFRRSHAHEITENKPAQKPAGLPVLNSPKPKPKQETGATNQTKLNETEKEIGGS